MADDDDRMYFTMSGRNFVFDANADRLTGDELIEVESRTGLSMMGWFQRMSDPAQLNARDICLLGFLAARRVDPMVQWDPFVRSIHPLTFRWTDPPAEAAASAPARNSASRRTPAKT